MSRLEETTNEEFMQRFFNSPTLNQLAAEYVSTATLPRYNILKLIGYFTSVLNSYNPNIAEQLSEDFSTRIIELARQFKDMAPSPNTIFANPNIAADYARLFAFLAHPQFKEDNCRKQVHGILKNLPYPKDFDSSRLTSLLNYLSSIPNKAKELADIAIEEIAGVMLVTIAYAVLNNWIRETKGNVDCYWRETQAFDRRNNKLKIVNHSALNHLREEDELARIVQSTADMQHHISGRVLSTTIEGDVVEVVETGEIVLTHKSWLPLHQKEYIALRKQKLAVSLTEVLDIVSNYKSRTGQKVELCLELKAITSADTINKTILLLKRYPDINAYFDSFFGHKLDEALSAMKDNNSDSDNKISLPRSLHLVGNIGHVKFMMTPPTTYVYEPRGYEIITVPFPMSIGHPGENVIFGAVGSLTQLQKLAEDLHVRGVYARFKEGPGITGGIWKIINSVTNDPRLRRLTMVGSPMPEPVFADSYR